MYLPHFLEKNFIIEVIGLFKVGSLVKIGNKKGLIVGIDIEESPILNYPVKYRVSIDDSEEEFFEEELSEYDGDYLLDDFYDRCLG